MRRNLARTPWLWRLSSPRIKANLDREPDHVRPYLEAGVEAAAAVKLSKVLRKRLGRIATMVVEYEPRAAETRCRSALPEAAECRTQMGSGSAMHSPSSARS